MVLSWIHQMIFQCEISPGNHRLENMERVPLWVKGLKHPSWCRLVIRATPNKSSVTFGRDCVPGGDDSFMQRPACQVSGWLILASEVGAGCEQEIRSPWRQVPSIRVMTPQPHAGGTGRDDESERGRSLLGLAPKKCRWWMVGTCLDSKSSFFSPQILIMLLSDNYIVWNFESLC